MAEEVTGERSKSGKETPKQKRRAQILVAAAVLGVILTAILVMRRGSNTSASSSALPSGMSPDYGGGIPQQGYGGSYGGSPQTIPISTGVGSGTLPSDVAPQYTAQEVRDLATQMGAPLAYGSESATDRVNRIVRQLNAQDSSQRSWDSVVQGFQYDVGHPMTQAHPQTLAQPMNVTVHAPHLATTTTHPPLH